MTRPSWPYCFCSRRARERTSMALSAGVSSMRIGASDRRPSALDSFSQSSGPRRPVRSLCWSGVPTEPIMRIASCDAPISIENTTTGSFSSSATCSPMLSASAVLPMRRPAGHDHEVARLQARRHPVEVGDSRWRRRSRRTGRRGCRAFSMRSTTADSSSLSDRERALAARALLGDVQHLRLGLVEHRRARCGRAGCTPSRRSRRRSRRAGAGSSARARSRVVADVRGRGHVLRPARRGRRGRRRSRASARSRAPRTA